MKVSLFVLWGDSLTYTMAKALAYNSHKVHIWVADRARHRKAVWGSPQRIASIPNVTVNVDMVNTPPQQIDQLIVQGHPLLLRYKDLLDRLAPLATKLTAVSAGDRSRPYRQALRLQWRERRWLGRWFQKVARVAYKDGYYPLDLLGILRSRRVVGFDAHANFLQDEALCRAIHAQDWELDAKRSIRVNFVGSRDPEARDQVLAQVEDFFTSPAAMEVDDGTGNRVVWHVYTDSQPAPLSPQEFVRTLSQSDFTLAPPGYSLVTHRPAEALLRGSVPVLHADELDLYDLGLVDGVNCIAVPRGKWLDAMERIRNIDEKQLIRMRRCIRSMYADRLAYPVLARDICCRLGVVG